MSVWTVIQEEKTRKLEELSQERKALTELDLELRRQDRRVRVLVAEINALEAAQESLEKSGLKGDVK